MYHSILQVALSSMQADEPKPEQLNGSISVGKRHRPAEYPAFDGDLGGVGARVAGLVFGGAVEF
jgi:hypothetical protein